MVWRQDSDVAKVRAYTRQSFLSMMLLVGASGVAIAVGQRTWLGGVAIALAALASYTTLQRIPSIGGESTSSIRVPLTATVVFAAVAGAVIGTGGAVCITVIVATPLVALVAFRWSIAGALVLAVATGLAGFGWLAAAGMAFVVATIAATLTLSVWLLRIVTELDSARQAAGLLSVAEERLRFSRDIHDVVGRALSAIAVKSELAATLARRGDSRAAEQMDEVRDLAQQSMTDTRALVRGYRSIDLPAELTGATSLLNAAGISTDVVGDSDDVDAASAEAAAWVVREGTTNVLRHSAATYCRIELSRNGIRMTNDASHDGSGRGDGTGIGSLRERLGAVGGSVETERTGETFVLSATFVTKGRP